ncbi:MAG TPA: hypothetical protein GX497_05015 [Bacillus bacterium]|nr:hypothetical protein [Bacillus sp. (in: firmicutes)]
MEFNTDLDSNFNDSDIYVVNKYGEMEFNHIELVTSRILKVSPPPGGYEAGETYYSVVEKTIRSSKDKNLKEAVTFKVTISK